MTEISKIVEKEIVEENVVEIPVAKVHILVEKALDKVCEDVAKSYREYRNYKQDFIHIMDDVLKESQSIRYIGDRDNANTDSALVATKRSLIYKKLNRELYQKFFLTKEEVETIHTGYLYVHDASDRLDTMNCCLFDMETVLKGGFEASNVFYTEPGSLDTAFDVMNSVIMMAAAQQYGGFTIPEIDKTLAYYAEKSYQKHYNEYLSMVKNILEVSQDSMVYHEYYNRADEYAYKKVVREMEQGVQGMELQLNTVGSSRGDYPFTTVTFGIGTGRWERLASSTFMKVRKEGQGAPGKKIPVLFPKLVFLYDENLHGPGKELEWLYDEAIDCSSKAMYPDFLSMNNGYVGEVYQKYGRVISPMRMSCLS